MAERRYDPDREDLYGAAGETLRRFLDELKHLARARPLESLVAAFVLGLLVVLLGRKNR